ncbi:MAG: hypothetical protein DLM61_23145 [Pseudonocardiales bacterium]|nr:MAG: hypothetical protein DLM61_23145 [Pseudonocardiales bacterium]
MVAWLPAGGKPASRWSLTRQEFLVAITNPKALLLFAAFIPQFITTHGSAAPQLLIAGFTYIGIEAFPALGYATLGGRLGDLEITRRTQRRLDRITGMSFLGLRRLSPEHRP